MVGLVGAAVLLTGCRSTSATLQGVVIEPSPSVVSVTLPPGSSALASVVPKAGSVNLVYFGYTHCPDVCPTTLAGLKRVFSELGAKRTARVNLAMFTVDPKRDRPSVLREYLDYFDERFSPIVIDDPKQLRSIADAFGADYSVTTSAKGDIEVSHTGGLYAVDSTGHIAVQWPFDADPKASNVIAHDLKVLLQRTATNGSTP